LQKRIYNYRQYQEFLTFKSKAFLKETVTSCNDELLWDFQCTECEAIFSASKCASRDSHTFRLFWVFPKNSFDGYYGK